MRRRCAAGLMLSLSFPIIEPHWLMTTLALGTQQLRVARTPFCRFAVCDVCRLPQDSFTLFSISPQLLGSPIPVDDIVGASKRCSRSRRHLGQIAAHMGCYRQIATTTHSGELTLKASYHRP